MITREEYRRRKKLQRAKATKHTTAVSTFRPVNENRTNLEPPSNKSLNGEFIDGFHQVLAFSMQIFRKGWHLLNNISFIKRYNQKQDASFKRNKSFITTNWSSHVNSQSNGKESKASEHKQKNQSNFNHHVNLKKSTKDKPSNDYASKVKVGNKHKKSKPVVLDKKFVDMMKHK